MIRNRTCLHPDEDICQGHSIEAKYCQQIQCPQSQGNVLCILTGKWVLPMGCVPPSQ
jgi:hypothetical protein